MFGPLLLCQVISDSGHISSTRIGRSKLSFTVCRVDTQRRTFAIRPRTYSLEGEIRSKKCESVVGKAREIIGYRCRVHRKPMSVAKRFGGRLACRHPHVDIGRRIGKIALPGTVNQGAARLAKRAVDFTGLGVDAWAQ